MVPVELDFNVDCLELSSAFGARLLDLEEVDEELLVEGEDAAALHSTGSERVEVRDENEEDTESSLGCCCKLLGIISLVFTRMGLRVCFSDVLFKAFRIISMVHTVCRRELLGDDDPPAAKFRSSSTFDSSSSS